MLFPCLGDGGLFLSGLASSYCGWRRRGSRYRWYRSYGMEVMFWRDFLCPMSGDVSDVTMCISRSFNSHMAWTNIWGGDMIRSYLILSVVGGLPF